MITQEEALDVFEYCDGNLFWKKKTCRKVVAGEKIYAVNSQGYLTASYERKKYRVHKIIFLMHHGWAPAIVDHIDRNKLNNNIENLRPATQTQNTQNSTKRSTNTSGYKGVSWYKMRGKWVAMIGFKGKQIYLGIFLNKIDAAIAYDQAAIKYYKDFAYTNFKESEI